MSHGIFFVYSEKIITCLICDCFAIKTIISQDPQFVKKCIRCITCHLSTLQLHKVKTRCIIMLSGLSLSADKLTNTLPCLWHFWLILEKSTMTGQIWCNLSLFFQGAIVQLECELANLKMMKQSWYAVEEFLY